MINDVPPGVAGTVAGIVQMSARIKAERAVNEGWITHLRNLAKDNAELRVMIRTLRLEVTSLKDEVEHYRIEFARQNAKLVEIGIRKKIEDA